MPRTSKKPQETITASEGVSVILDTPVLKTVSEAAEYVGVAEIRLLELFSDALKLPEAMGWEVIPQEHEHLLNEFKSQANDTKVLLEEFTHPEKEALQQPEPLVLEDAPKPAKQSKRKSTGLTKNRVNAIQQTIQDAVTLEEGIHETELNVATQEGIQDGGQIATTYLIAKQVTENKIRSEAAKRRVAKTIQKTAKQKDFDPLAVLQKHGLNPTSDDLCELNELATPAMTSLGNASGEILSNSWANGLQIDCTDLTSLMSDAWSD